MSKPSNPLSKLQAYEVKHVLLAFDNTQAACEFTTSRGRIGMCGSDLKLDGKACGSGYVVINEFEDQTFFISGLQWTYDFYGPVNPDSAVCIGKFTVAGFDSLNFPNFLRQISLNLGLATSQITFVLHTHFLGKKTHDSNKVNISAAPLVFSLLDYHSSMEEDVAELFTYNFVTQALTLPQLPQYSTLAQTTITHSDGTLGHAGPSTDGATKGIMSSKKENQIKNAARHNRLNKSKPMKTLKELADGLQQELNDQKYINRRQVQEFLSLIRDSHSKKIKDPIQKKDEYGGIPVSYTITLDSAIVNYPVNNRNLPFEQSEQNQQVPGISSYTFSPDSNVFTALNEILKTSTHTADDVRAGYSFKITSALNHTCDGKYEIYIKVNRFKTPRNEVDMVNGVNTAPGDGSIKALEFFYGEGNEVDLDIFNMVMAIGPDITTAGAESDTDDSNGSKVVYGDREQMTIERAPSQYFGTSFYSGSRNLSSPENYGLESGSSGVVIDINNSPTTRRQTSYTVINIHGNPELYSDLCRTPLMIRNNDVGNAILYKYPEFEPMYVKLTIRLNPNAVGRKNGDPYYYYKGYYHLGSVTNIIDGSSFIQSLNLYRTDDIQ